MLTIYDEITKDKASFVTMSDNMEGDTFWTCEISAEEWCKFDIEVNRKTSMLTGGSHSLPATSKNSNSIHKDRGESVDNSKVEYNVKINVQATKSYPPSANVATAIFKISSKTKTEDVQRLQTNGAAASANTINDKDVSILQNQPNTKPEVYMNTAHSNVHNSSIKSHTVTGISVHRNKEHLTMASTHAAKPFLKNPYATKSPANALRDSHTVTVKQRTYPIEHHVGIRLPRLTHLIYWILFAFVFQTTT